MSVSNQIPSYPLTIDASQQYLYISKLSIFDSLSRPVVSNIVQFPYSETLPRGLYTIRVEISGAFRDSIITHEWNGFYLITTGPAYSLNMITINPPDIYSSALFYDPNRQIYPSSHEYYTSEAQTGSAQYTCEFAQMQAADCSLFVFLRFPSKEKFGQLGKGARSFDGYELLLSSGDLLCSLNDTDKVKTHLEYGWMYFNAKLTEGLYYLSCPGTPPRMIPIYVYREWNTQCFLLIGKEPLYGSIRIFLSRLRSYDPDDELNKITDVLLTKLQNRDYTLNTELLDSIAYGKFESPMLGLLGAYLYLSGGSNKEDGLFKTILTNLQQLILKDNEESPDLQALRILANRHFGDSYRIRNAVIKGTPMLRVGYEAIKTAAVEKSRIIKTNSINDLIAENTFSDSPFNTFKTVRIRMDEFRKNSPSLAFTDESKEQFFLAEGLSNYQARLEGPKDPDKRAKRKRWDVPVKDLLGAGKYQSFLKKVAKGDPDLSWLNFSIADALKREDSLTIKQLSRQMQVPANTISRVLEEFRKLP